MTDMGYAPVVGKRGPKPERGRAKRPFATRLPVEHIEFLRSQPNAAGWLEGVIDRAIRRKQAKEAGRAAAKP